MKIRETKIKNIVIGSGAAGLSAAIRLVQCGQTDLAIITEGLNAGTSRNTGSDKQTYYKLGGAGTDHDSTESMAEDLFAGGCVDGDLALCEAALSTRCFYYLVELGVPFPYNEYSEYIGYKTDHDRGRRATSAGPYTSKMMTECLEKQVLNHKIPVLDQMQLIQLLVEDQKAYGAVFLEKNETKEASYLIIWCENIILATGGPAGMYHDSVYPRSQHGASGIAFMAGAKGKNLTEWQYGLASLHPRWNVSGTYMQVLPKFISTDPEGYDEREFLLDFFEKPEDMLTQIFMKGYQWPFDVNKIFGGSSIIDLLVYQETILKNRRVYLDFSSNTGNTDILFEKISGEAKEYLEKAGALGGTPIERLQIMNRPAIEFYKNHGICLGTEKLEIAICAQHNNGGLSTDANWETSIWGLFAVGEVNGSHGVTRPGGSALNAGQVGAVRAAECIRIRALTPLNRTEDTDKINKIRLREMAEAYLRTIEMTGGGEVSIGEAWTSTAKRMSEAGGMIREETKIKKALEQTEFILDRFESTLQKPGIKTLPLYYRLYDMLFSQKIYLTAMLDYAGRGAGSRGSALYSTKEGEKPDKCLPELFRCKLGGRRDVIQEIVNEKGKCIIEWRPVRKIPERDSFFENVWRQFRENML